jgi:hypothetical protein
MVCHEESDCLIARRRRGNSVRAFPERFLPGHGIKPDSMALRMILKGRRS